MQINSIKKLVENESLGNLRKAVDEIEQEQPLSIPIDGANEGEKLTHVLAAVWILEKMQCETVDFKTALRAYTKRVRTSIH